MAQGHSEIADATPKTRFLFQNLVCLVMAMSLKVEFQLHLLSFLEVNVHNGAYPTRSLMSSGFSVGNNHLINLDDLHLR